MEDRLKRILSQKKITGLNWNDLAKGLSITGDGVRAAFKRGSVDEAYLDVIESNLRLPSKSGLYEQKETNLIKVEDIPSFIVGNEERLMKDPAFKFWLSDKIKDGIIKFLQSR